MPDGPWTKYAQQAPAESGPWTKYASTQEATAPEPEQPVDTRNAAQQYLDRSYAPQSLEGQPPLKRAALEFGRGATQSLVAPISHPVETGKSLAKAIQPDAGAAGLAEGLIGGPAGPLMAHTLEGTYRDYKQNGLAHALGGLAGGFASGEAPKSLPLEGIGEAMQGGGAKLIDNTVGLRKADVARGAQPGRAYLEGGGGPAFTMRGIANRASKIADRTGAELGSKYGEATNTGVTLPSDRIAGVLSEPINKAIAIREGPGGTGGTSAFQEYRDSLSPILQKPNLTPNELWAAKKNIAANTRWNDPTQFDLNKVRQMNVGALSGELSDAVPGTARLNKVFQGNTNLARRAGERADTGQMPLSQIGRRAMEAGLGGIAGSVTHHTPLAAVPLVLDSVPVKTSLAKGLFVGGKSLPAAAPLAKTIGPFAGVTGATALSPEGKPKAKSNKE